MPTFVCKTRRDHVCAGWRNLASRSAICHEQRSSELCTIDAGSTCVEYARYCEGGVVINEKYWVCLHHFMFDGSRANSVDDILRMPGFPKLPERTMIQLAKMVMERGFKTQLTHVSTTSTLTVEEVESDLTVHVEQMDAWTLEVWWHCTNVFLPHSPSHNDDQSIGQDSSKTLSCPHIPFLLP
jgi:hypothetical protein